MGNPGQAHSESGVIGIGIGRLNPKAMAQEWEDETFAFLEAMSFRPADETVVLAVSGGADSMALLEFWYRAGAPRFRCRLHAVHIHHGLRASADCDQALVESACRESSIPLSTFRLDPGSRRTGESVEMWARRERYRCFAEAAATACARDGSARAYLLTGHHRDDVVETVFQRLGRGTGPRGLGGIPFRRHPFIVRPLLNRSRREILQYLDIRGRSWREDESNADTRIGRNWFRHRYLPGLRAAEPDLDARIFSLAMQVQGMAENLNALEEDADLLRRDPEGEAYLPVEEVEERLALRDFHSLRHWLARLAAEAAAAKTKVNAAKIEVVTEEILRELHRQWSNGTRRLRVPVSPGSYLEGRKLGIYWEKTEAIALTHPGTSRPPKKECSGLAQRIILDLGTGSFAWSWGDRAYTLSIKRYPRPPNLQFPGSAEPRAIFDAGLISCTLLVRTRKDGDLFSPYGVKSESRKLKVFLNEEKIPVGVRDQIPLVFALSPDRATETLAWVPGHGISDFFKVGAQTATILEMELTCQNP